MSEPPTMFNLLDYPICLDMPARVSAIAWQEHIPFAKVLMQMARPKVLVELGVHTGDSYLSFCEVAAALNLDIACYGVDSWLGDPHAGYYGEQVLAELRAYHDPLYGKFSRLVRGTFDEAEKHFQPGSIDLLHIDGQHTYEAVRHDWETWRGKLSRRGIVLFHDVNVREHDFGVWRLWEEIRDQHPHFEFKHGHGLGVLAVGPQLAPAVGEFLAFAKDNAALLERLFFALGNRITLSAASCRLGLLETQLAECQRASAAATTELAGLRAKLGEYHQTLSNKDAELSRLQGELGSYHTAVTGKDAFIAQLEAAGQLKDKELELLRGRVAELSADLSLANAKLAQFATTARADAAARVASEAREHETAAQLALVQAGLSYRVGRAVTAPARWLTGKA